jgi:hypothetical protein
MSPGSWLGNLFAGTHRPAGESREDRFTPAVLTDNSTSDTPSPANAYLLLREAIDSFNQGHTQAGGNQSGGRSSTPSAPCGARGPTPPCRRTHRRSPVAHRGGGMRTAARTTAPVGAGEVGRGLHSPSRRPAAAADPAELGAVTHGLPAPQRSAGSHDVFG